MSSTVQASRKTNPFFSRLSSLLPRSVLFAVCWGFLFAGNGTVSAQDKQVEGVRVGTFKQQVGKLFPAEETIPQVPARSVAVGPNGGVYAGTVKGLSRYSEGVWNWVDGLTEKPVELVVNAGDELLATSEGMLYRISDEGVKEITKLPDAAHRTERLRCLAVLSAPKRRKIVLGTSVGLFILDGFDFVLAEDLTDCGEIVQDIRQVAAGPNGELAVASNEGLFRLKKGGDWERLVPESGIVKWHLYDVNGVAFDSRGRLWFASPQGVGCLDEKWTLYTGRNGLPYDEFTMASRGEEGVVWFGTRVGAIRFDGKEWEYRQGRRWLPGDQINGLDVDSEGNAWFATEKGIGAILLEPMTLAQKAEFFENEIDKRHRRTPFGYVLQVSLETPGDLSQWRNQDSDNDGLWTGMYGAGECFAYGATKNKKAKQRAKDAFEALRFLSQVTQGGEHPAPKGFPARSILPTSGPDPNETEYTIEKDERKRDNQDKRWKIIHPRWPRSEDGKWFWKCDTSSDELDGHYFFYATYYDLVAETEEEKQRVREVTLAITDHLIDHNYSLVDWDGEPTRWAQFGPEQMNFDSDWWEERGLNSLSILSYLKVAEHMSGGGEKYKKAYDELITQHGYAQNLLVPKIHLGPGTGNHSDDEMALMGYYNLLKYEKDPDLRERYAFSLYNYWRLIEAELNPFFNYVVMASLRGEWYEDSWNKFELTPDQICLDDAAGTLIRYPVNLVSWRMENSHRIDLLPIPSNLGVPKEPFRHGYRVNGDVLPIDERFVQHWSHNPWNLDYGGNGKTVADGAAYLLGYYMGLYHKFIVEN